MRVSDDVLCGVEFVDVGTTPVDEDGPRFVTCGDDGIFVFRWSDVCLRIRADCPSSSTNNNEDVMMIRDLTPLLVLRPHPIPAPPSRSLSSSTSWGTEINGIAYDKVTRTLYGAAGDLFGGYVWNVNSGLLLGNLGEGAAGATGGVRRGETEEEGKQRNKQSYG